MHAWPRCLLVIAALLVGVCLHVSAVTYYVSSSWGRDTNLGLAGSPWQTLARVNRARLRPGDIVLFRRGDLWRETLRPGSSGAEGNVIRFGAYGTGPKPVISGSNSDSGPLVRDIGIDNNEQSHVVYEDFDLRNVRHGLRLYSWRAQVRDVTLQNCNVTTGPTQPHGTMSAGVYASVNTGSLSSITIRNNRFMPYPTGLEHWGVYFVRGVSDFTIEANRFGPAGEDAITIWHSDHGLIANNAGGGNGEDTIDVKDSHDVIIRGNRAESDREYNIVVHGVDSGRLTYNVTVEKNQCRQGGRGGHLDAGIALLFVRDSAARENMVEGAYGSGIFVYDAGTGGGNEISFNELRGNGTGRATNAIRLKEVSEISIHDNHLAPAPQRDAAAVR
ncbi:MAG: right-handed parallel beta-helix repeat-containing protein [Acidobacteriia bacterium]|nr:right-handed parallel beta-helix repeat-containing protein [Terriglobia bacterium]